MGQALRLIEDLKKKTVDEENRLRRSNLRVVGLPEDATLETYTEYMLVQLFGRQTFSAAFVVERAHRVLPKKTPPGVPPRTFIMKLLNYRDCDAALKFARENGMLTVVNVAIAIYPDYSEISQRSQFQTVRRKLRALSLPYAMIYPSRLRVVDQGKVTFFCTPDEAYAWLEGRCPAESPSPDSQPRGVPFFFTHTP